MKYSLSTLDLLKGLLVAVGTAVSATIMDSLNKGSLDFNWKLIGVSALSAAIAYLGKNFFTDNTTQAKNILKEAAVDHAEASKVDAIETKK